MDTHTYLHTRIHTHTHTHTHTHNLLTKSISVNLLFRLLKLRRAQSERWRKED